MKKKNFPLISDRASVTDMLDLGLIPCLAFSSKKGQREDSTVRGRTRRGSLTQRPKSSFVVSWPKQLGEYNKITKINSAYKPLMQARHQDSMTGGQKWILGGTRSLLMWIQECGLNEEGEDQKTKRSLVQKFRQTLVFISKFLRFSTNPKVKTKKKISL